MNHAGMEGLLKLHCQEFPLYIHSKQYSETFVQREVFTAALFIKTLKSVWGGRHLRRPPLQGVS